MLEAIITYLNLKLGLLNYFEQQHCLCELKSDNEGKVSPVEYVGDANYTVVSHDAFDGVSYWRLRDKPTQDVLETKYQAGKRVEVKIPLRLVFSVRRDKLTTDDAYAFDRIRQTVVAQFNFDDGILKTTLGCEKVTVSVPTSNGDAKEVWDEETSETGTFEPTYAMVYGSIDIEVSVIYAGSCLPTECDDIDPNILHAFDFCKPSVVAQLTAEQVTCLEGELCVPLCEQLAAILPEDVVADVFDCLTLAAQTELLDSECVIPPCSPVTQQVNGTTIGTTASGGTNNQVIRNTAGTAVGTSANPSVIANTTLRNSATPTWTDSVVSGVTKTLAQGKALDSDGATTLLANYIPTANGFMFTCTPSPPCADATVTINGASLGATGTIPSGGSEDLDVLQGGSPVGSWNGSAWIIPTCPAVPSLSIALSDSTPNFGDAVTITVTPTGITPTSYTFGLPNKYGDLVNVTQASNVYVWTANNIGADSVVVTATDGASIAANSISVTTTVDVPFVSPKAVFSYYKLIAAYAGQWIRVRRTDTGVESDIPYTNGVGDISAITAFVGTSAFTVVTRYNQASNGNQTQTTASLQTVLKGDSFDVFQEWFGFNAQRMPLTLVSGLAANQTSTEYLIQKMSYNITGNTRISVDSGTTMIINSALVGSANSISLYDPSNVVYTPALRLTSKHLLTAQFKNADPRVRYNGANQALTVASGSTAAFATKAYTIKYLYGDNAAGFKSNEVASYAYCIDAGDLSAAVEAILMELYDI